MNSDLKRLHLLGLPVTLQASSEGGPADVVRGFSLFWAAGDIDGALAFIAEHCVYALYISGDLLPFAGETAGRDGIAGALRQMRADYEYLLYRPLDLIEKGDEVRYQVEFMYRHRRSGEVLNGRFRMIMRVEDGLIVRADEYHDRAKVEAFLRLFCC
jgi:ketosteroid isomerase-like protein